MPGWEEVLDEIRASGGDFDGVRAKYLRELHAHTGRPVLAYYSSWLTKPTDDGTHITDQDRVGVMACVHQMDRDKGLDLLLHTPGGELAATESIVYYLRSLFGDDIRAIVPQCAMSAGTLIALSCRAIVMGRQSNLGPIDPQFGHLSAFAIRKEWEEAYGDIMLDPAARHAWGFILQQLTPGFLTKCQYAIQRVGHLAEEYLARNMLQGRDGGPALARAIVGKLGDLEANKGHDRPFHFEECAAMGLEIEVLEDDQTLQDLVLSVHHSFDHLLSNGPCLKAIENHQGKRYMKNQQAPRSEAEEVLAEILA